MTVATSNKLPLAWGIIIYMATIHLVALLALFPVTSAGEQSELLLYCIGLQQVGYYPRISSFGYSS